MWAELKRVRKDRSAIVLFGSEPFSSHLRISNIKEFKYDWIWRKNSGTGFLNAKKQPLRDSEVISVFYSTQPHYSPQMRTGFKPYSCKQGDKKSQNYGAQSGAVTVSNGSRYPLNTLYFKRDKTKEHPTQKPVALLEYLIKTYTNEGETVLDFTMGSGSTGVACVNTNRNFIGIEKEQEYFEIAKARIEACKI
jgi:site-specific DNA-methyltransferase (adenine-specific)